MAGYPLMSPAAFAGLTAERLPVRLLDVGPDAVAHLELFFGLMASLDYGLGQGCGVSACRGQLGVVIPAVKAAGYTDAGLLTLKHAPRRVVYDV
jgi:hypothetical protein